MNRKLSYFSIYFSNKETFLLSQISCEIIAESQPFHPKKRYVYLKGIV